MIFVNIIKKCRCKVKLPSDVEIEGYLLLSCGQTIIGSLKIKGMYHPSEIIPPLSVVRY